MIRPSIRFASLLALVTFLLSALLANAQQDLPAAPTAPSPAAAVPAVERYPMPKPIPGNFTASSPTKETIDAFLKTNLGGDGSRIWEVWAIEKSQVEGVSLVTVLVNDKSETQKPFAIQFYGMPDGQHFIITGKNGMTMLPVAKDQPATPAVPDSPAAAPANPNSTDATLVPNKFSMPKPDPSNFTATLPSKETVETFLKVSWGYDDSRVWEVWAIEKTSTEGVSKVTLLVNDKNETQKPIQSSFYTLADGKHLLTLDKFGRLAIMPFGENPYKDYRELVRQHADGPYRGSALKDLEIVEFADFECPHCREAQANMEKLAADFPKARFVFLNRPLGNAQWKGSMPAAAYGVCVAKQAGSDAFFNYAAAVFDGQAGLVSEDGVTLTLNAAVAKVGLEPAKIAACASTPATAAVIEASTKLATELNVNETPTLVINGRELSATLPYETIKRVILYQAKLDGVTAQ